MHSAKQKSPVHVALSSFALLPGGVLLSQGLPPQVSSALEVLTVVFGMGTRVSPPPLPPDIYVCSSHILCVEVIHPSYRIRSTHCTLQTKQRILSYRFPCLFR